MKETDDEEELPTLPPNFRLRPSRNQKQRSKLNQAPEPPSSPTEEEASPAPATPTPPPSAPPKKMRLKRSGHMHEDLTAPIPEGPPKKKPTEY